MYIARLKEAERSIMETECENQEGVPENLREQLALALRSIQWSYGIFWSISSNSPGVLKWVDGYYNGEIKTRKTVQTAEVNAEQMGLQRSEQLRELYESLLVGEASPQARRPSAALSPEDLTEAEWYYLVCMSFTFNIGQGLPGRAISKNQTIWLCNAHQAESKTFSRSLLAKSASIQTVVCFPCLGGIIELGATELISEDLKLIERVKASFLEIPYPTAAQITSYVSANARNEQDVNAANFDHDMPKTDLNPLIEGEEEIICSPNNSSNGFRANQQAEDPYIVEGIIREASQVQSWYLLDDAMSNHVHHSVNSSDSISQSYATPQNVSRLSNGEKLQNDAQHDIQESNQKEMSSFNPRGEDVHYQSVLSNLLKSSHQLILGPYFRNGKRDSSFMSWKKEASVSFQAPRSGTPQRLLKKVLFEVAKLHNGYLVEPDKDNCRSESILQQEVNGIDKNHVFSERRRREKINERFMILSSMVPTKSKADKLSILDDTIEYLKQLGRRVQELESCKELVPKTRTPHDAVERTSDNYGTTKRGISKKPQLKKRKARDIDDTEPGNERSVLRDCSTDDVAVSLIDKDIWIEMRLPWRDGVLLEIMEVMSNLHLDSDAIQSTNSEGIVSVTIKSKLKGSKVSSAGMIRQALQSLIKK